MFIQYLGLLNKHFYSQWNNVKLKQICFQCTLKKFHLISRYLKSQLKKKSWVYKWGTFHKVSHRTILNFQADEQNEVGQHRQKITRCGKHTDYGGLTLLFQVRIISFRPQNLLAWRSWGYILCMFIISCFKHERLIAQLFFKVS